MGSEADFYSYFFLITAALLCFGMLFFLRRTLFQLSKFQKESLKQSLSCNAFKEEKQQLAEMLKIKDDLLKHTSHEFKTLITVLLGYLDDFKTVHSESNTKTCELVERQVRYMNELVNQILELSKLEGQIRVEKKRVNLSHGLNKIISVYDGYANQLDIEISVLIEKDLIIGADPDCIERIFSNLISNAIKYNQKGGKVSIIAIEAEEYAQITVKDTGIGIANKDQKVIFKQFGKVEPSCALDHSVLSTGLGLAIVKESVRANYGDLELRSEVGVGSEFIVRFPLADKSFLESFAEEHEVELNIKNNSLIPASHAKTLLIVEDMQDIASLVCSIFDSEYQIIQAKNGVEGYELAKKILPDLIITDLMMPILDGYEFTKLIKNDIKTQHIPLIFLTAIDSEKAESMALSLGAIDFIKKPFSVEGIKLKVKMALQNPQKQNSQKELLSEPKKPRKNHARAPWFIQRLNDYIDKNIEEKISVEDMSKSLGMNRSALTRKVKDITSLNTQQYILHFRLQKAYEMLPKAKSVAEVAYSLGFNTQNHLSTAFTKQFGITCRERLSNKTLIKNAMLVESL